MKAKSQKCAIRSTCECQRIQKYVSFDAHEKTKIISNILNMHKDIPIPTYIVNTESTCLSRNETFLFRNRDSNQLRQHFVGTEEIHKWRIIIIITLEVKNCSVSWPQIARQLLAARGRILHFSLFDFIVHWNSLFAVRLFLSWLRPGGGSGGGGGS